MWEDARVWAYWNHSFDLHLVYLGPVSGFSPSWVPSGYTARDSCSGCWLGGGQPVCLQPEILQGTWLGTPAVAVGLEVDSLFVSNPSPFRAAVADGLMVAASFVYWYGRWHFSSTLLTLILPHKHFAVTQTCYRIPAQGFAPAVSTVWSTVPQIALMSRFSGH